MKIHFTFSKEELENVKNNNPRNIGHFCDGVDCFKIDCTICPLQKLNTKKETVAYVKAHLEKEE